MTEEDIQYHKMMKRYCQNHTEGEWIRFYKFSVKLGLRPSEVAKLMTTRQRRITKQFISFWLEEMKKFGLI